MEGQNPRPRLVTTGGLRDRIFVTSAISEGEEKPRGSRAESPRVPLIREKMTTSEGFLCFREHRGDSVGMMLLPKCFRAQRHLRCFLWLGTSEAHHPTESPCVAETQKTSTGSHFFPNQCTRGDSALEPPRFFFRPSEIATSQRFGRRRPTGCDQPRPGILTFHLHWNPSLHCDGKNRIDNRCCRFADLKPSPSSLKHALESHSSHEKHGNMASFTEVPFAPKELLGIVTCFVAESGGSDEEDIPT